MRQGDLIVAAGRVRLKKKKNDKKKKSLQWGSLTSHQYEGSLLLTRRYGLRFAVYDTKIPNLNHNPNPHLDDDDALTSDRVPQI